MAPTVEVKKPALRERWLEFFEDQDGGLSMTRLLCFLSFWPAAYALVVSTPAERATILGLVLGAYALNYGVGKSIDAWREAKTTGTETPTKEGGDTNVAITVSPAK